jgi:hypothetical protein
VRRDELPSARAGDGTFPYDFELEHGETTNQYATIRPKIIIKDIGADSAGCCRLFFISKIAF